MTHKDPQLVAKWFDCNQYTGALVVRDLPQVQYRNHKYKRPQIDIRMYAARAVTVARNCEGGPEVKADVIVS